jgi:uncharacterized protein (TIGR03118 family)
MAFLKGRIKFLTMVTTGLLLLSGLAFSSFAFSSRQAAKASGGGSTEGFYVQTNLVSDLANIAKVQDTHLVNSWGLVHGPKTPWWVADNGTGFSTLYNGNGTPFPVGSPLVVTIPPPASSPAGTTAAPTGIVFNDLNSTNPDDFVVSENGTSGPSLFMFATEDGTISGWNATVDLHHAILAVDNSKVKMGQFTGAVYKGLATGHSNNKDFIYGANFRFGTVDQFDANFKFVRSFTDPDLNKQCNLNVLTNQCFAPFGIRNIGGKLYVTFAFQKPGTAGQPNTFKHDDLAGLGNGFVDVFSTGGKLLSRFASQGTLNSPWGLTLTPDNFGPFSNDLLVGNFGDGRINIFNPGTGAFLGQLPDQAGDPITINGLWGIAFGNGNLAGETDELFFAAGLNDEANGLFGKIQFVTDNS